MSEFSVDPGGGRTRDRRAGKNRQRRPADEDGDGKKEPTAFQRAFMYRRKLEASYGMLLRSKERARTAIKYSLLLGSLILLGLLIAGAILLETAESCRYPRYEFTETFTYEIDTKAVFAENIYNQGKLSLIRGGKIKTLFLSQYFGTYTITTDPTESLTAVKFIVSNRAKDQYFLPRITSFRAESVLDQKTVNGVNFTETAFNVYLFSNTSNAIYGEHSCKRADVEIIIPSACLLDESRLDVRVQKGHIRTKGDTSQANFDTVTFGNDVGEIIAHNLQGFRINLNTSVGTLEAANISAHYLFMLSRDDGGLITAENVTLYSGDNMDSCETVTMYKDGFPKIDKYAKTKVVCDQELGKFTIDSRGAENAGNPAVEVRRVSGGYISQKMRLGHTYMKLKACYDFYGHFNISSVYGTKTVNALVKPLTQLEILEAEEARATVNVTPILSTTPAWLELIKVTPAWTYGSILCPDDPLEQGEMEMTLDINIDTTGDITLDLVEPRLKWDGPEEDE